MKVIRRGFTYELSNFDDKNNLGQIVKFVEKEREGSSTFIVQDGTFNEELVEVLIDRLDYLNDKHMCIENVHAIKSAKELLFWLKERQKVKTSRIKTKLVN